GPQARGAALEAFAKTTVRPRGITHVGVFGRAKKQKLGLAAIFARRLGELAPLPKKAPMGAFTVRGRARPKLELQALLLTGDEVLRAPIELGKDGVFAVPLRFQEESSHDVLEILAQSERGPQVAALWR